MALSSQSLLVSGGSEWWQHVCRLLDPGPEYKEVEGGRRLVHGSTCACASSGTIAMRQVSCESQTNMPVNFELWTLLLLHVLLSIPTLCAVVQCNVSTGTKHTVHVYLNVLL